MRKSLLAAALLVGMVQTHVQAQILSTLTRQQIDDAIALGSKPKDARRLLQRYGLRPRVLGSNGHLIAVFTTPFSRVVALALEAHEKYEPLTPADIPPEALAPEVRIYAGPRVKVGGQREDLANVRAIVLRPHDSKDRSEVLLPSSTEEGPARLVNLFGVEWEGIGMSATFPAAAFVDGLDVHIVFDEKIPIAGLSSCSDCRIAIRTAGLK